MDDLPRDRSEAVATGGLYYFTGKPCRRGHQAVRLASSGHCRECVREYQSRPDVKLKYKGRQSEYNKSPERRAAARERARKKLSTEEGRRKHREQVKRSMRKPEVKAKIREIQKRYLRSPKGKAAIKRAGMKRRAVKLGAFPKWADVSALNAFVNGCPKGCHVDHIIPLQGATVCGLHCVENLQYLSREENSAKHNRIDPLSLEAVVCVLPAYRSYVAPEPLGSSGL